MGRDAFFRKHILPYLVFSKGERNGIVLLLVLLNLTWIIPVCLPEKGISLPADELTMIDSARKVWAKDDSQRLPRYRTNEKLAGAEGSGHERSAGSVARKLYEPFDPNTATEETWAASGIPARTVYTIRRYLEKGGRFRRPDDLRKIYGLTERDFMAVRPRIRIETDAGPGKQAVAPTGLANNKMYVRPQGSESHGSASNTLDSRHFNGQQRTFRKTPKVLDINGADSADWESLPGIGPVLARRIVQFRSGLGGFSEVKQVAEVFGLPDSVFRLIEPQLRIEESSRPVPININQADIETLGNHPYVSRKLAGLIVAYRKQHGPYVSAEDLLAIPLVTVDLLNKLRPYLTFN